DRTHQRLTAEGLPAMTRDASECNHASPSDMDRYTPAVAARVYARTPSTRNVPSDGVRSSIRRSVRKRGTTTPMIPTTASDATPPSTTAGTVPSSLAVTPDSNAPSSFDEPMKIEFTEETRPSSCGGVSVCNSVPRINTLTLSATPLKPSSATERTKLRDKPNPRMQSAKTATADSIVRPARSKGGRC